MSPTSRTPLWTLGVSTGFAHDASAALIGDGRIVMAVEEERLDRVKFGKGFPHLAMARCLKAAGITLADVAAVGFNFQPWRMFGANILLNLREMVKPRAFKAAAFSRLRPMASTRVRNSWRAATWLMLNSKPRIF